MALDTIFKHLCFPHSFIFTFLFYTNYILYYTMSSTNTNYTLFNATSSTNAESNGIKEWKVDDFEIGRLLGSGRFGEVILSKEKKSGFIVALKIIHKERAKAENYTLAVKREILIQNHILFVLFLFIFY